MLGTRRRTYNCYRYKFVEIRYTQSTMNKHLEPVFNVLLSGLENAGIKYWVYGGVAIAAYARKFIRNNQDVDIFVEEAEYNVAKSVLKKLCDRYNFRLIEQKPLSKTNRPKFDIKINGEERLSGVPVYLTNEGVELGFWKGIEKYSYQMLTPTERVISTYRFFTPPDEFIKKLFINYLTSRRDKMNKSKIKIDAKAVFTDNEYSKYYQDEANS